LKYPTAWAQMKAEAVVALGTMVTAVPATVDFSAVG
jgi:hypothetical protein